MKAVVLELNNDYAAVLSEDGCIVTVKNNSYERGQVIIMKTNKNILLKKVMALAVSAAAIVMVGIGGWAYVSPYTYVSLDVNPSIEYTVNRFDRVIDIKAVNDDGEEILDKLSHDLKNKTIKETITETIQQISEEGYFAPEESNAPDMENDTENDSDSNDILGGIVITVSNKNSKVSNKLSVEILDLVEGVVAPEIEVKVTHIGLERVKEAKELGISPGKLYLIQKLQNSSTNPDNINMEDWVEKPVKDIVAAINENLHTKNFSDDTEDASEQTEEIADAAEKNADLDTTEDEVVVDINATEDEVVEDDNATEDEIVEDDNATEDANEEAIKNKDKAAKNKAEAIKNKEEAAKNKVEAAKKKEEAAKKKEEAIKNKDKSTKNPAEDQEEVAENQDEDQAEVAKEKAEDQAEKAKEKAEDQAEKAKEKAEDQAEKAKKQAEDQAEKAKKQAEELEATSNGRGIR